MKLIMVFLLIVLIAFSACSKSVSTTQDDLIIPTTDDTTVDEQIVAPIDIAADEVVAEDIFDETDMESDFQEW